jgi:parvulin-like peptidyl-prolyl isomerase
MRIRKMSLVLASAIVAAATVQAANELARVNNKVITLEEFNHRYSDSAKLFQAAAPTRKAVLDEMIKRELGIQEAHREGLEKDPDVRDQMDTVLYQALLNKKLNADFVKMHVSTAEAQAYYEKNPEIRTSNIFIPVVPNATPAEDAKAKAEMENIATMVRDGKQSFAELAQKFSRGPASVMGGDIQFQTRDKLDPTYYQAAIHLKMGQVSSVVRSQYGYHIIKLTDRRPWEDTDHGLAKRLLLEEKHAQLYDHYMGTLRAQAKVSVHSDLVHD